MKTIFFIIGLLLAMSSFGQTSVKIALYNLDSVEFSYKIAAPSEGDEIIIRSTFTYTFPADMQNPFIIQIGGMEVYNGTIQSWIDEGFSIHLVLPVMIHPNPNRVFEVWVNEFHSSNLKIAPLKITSIINPLDSAEKITYYTFQGLKIEQPSNGLYIWKAENGESGKIYLGAN